MRTVSYIGLRLVTGVLLLAATSFVSAEETDQKTFRLEPHPRLLLDKATKARLQEFVRQHPEDKTWQSAKGGMLGWQLAGDREAGRKAVERVVEQTKEWWANPPKRGTGFSHTSTAEAMAYALDWCYDLLTPEEKAEIVECGNNAAWGCLKGFCGIKPDYRGGPLPGSLYNHMTTRQLGALLWGIAAHGEGQQLPDESPLGVLEDITAHGGEPVQYADFFLGHCYKVLKDGMVPVYQPWVAGGAMWEGGDYGWADFRHTLQMMLAIKSATGEDLTRVINLADRIPFFIHATRPTGDCFYFQGHAWSNNMITGTLLPRYRNHMLQFANAYPEIGAYVPTYLKRTVLDEERGGGLEELLLALNFPEPKDYEIDWPPCWHARSLGVVLARSRWGDPDATHLSFICGPYIHYYSDQDQGHFEIFKRGRLVTDIRDRDVYLDVTLASCKHNTIVVGELGEPGAGWYDGPLNGGQRGVNQTVGTGGKIIALEDDYVNYLYVCGDLTNAYLADRIESYTRQIVFVRPDYVVVFDRVASPTPDWRKRFFLYLWNKPEAEGEYLTMRYAPSKLLIKTLLPRDPITKIIGPGYDGKRVSGYSLPLGNSYHLEIEPKEKAKEVRFLHFFKAGDVESKATPQCELVEKEGETGLKFTDGEYQCLVTFRTQGAAGGHIAIRRGSQPVVDRDFTREVLTPPLLIPPEGRKRQQEMIAKLQASRPQVGPEKLISDKVGGEFEFSGITWINLGDAKVTKTPDGTLHILTQSTQSGRMPGIRTKDTLDFPVQVEVKGKLRKLSDRISFGLCDKEGGHWVKTLRAGDEITSVVWITTETFLKEPIRFGNFYRILCMLNPGGIVPFEGAMTTEDGVNMGQADEEPCGVPYAHPEAKYLFIGDETLSARTNQIGSVQIKPLKGAARGGELLKWGRLIRRIVDVEEPPRGSLSHLARGQGWMYARSDLTSETTWVALHGGREGNFDDQGAFVIYKKGWLAVPTSISGWGCSENTLSLQAGEPAYYIGGARERGPVRGIERFEDENHYVYAMANLLNADTKKRVREEKLFDVSDFLDACERHLVFVRPDHVVLFDRVRPKNAKHYPIWRAHFTPEPKFSEKVVTACIERAGISLTTLLPEKVFRTKRLPGKSKKAWELTESEIGSEAPDAPKLPDVPSKEMLEEPSVDKFFLEMLEEPSIDKFFLHLFQTSAGEPKVPSAHLLKGKDTFGVKFALDTGYCEVVFKKDSSGGHIKIMAANEKVIMDRDLTTQVVPSKQ